jgi:hypothetical protein
MDKEKRFIIRNIAPDAVGWLLLAAPIGCNYVEIVNQTTVRCSDADRRKRIDTV